MPRRKDPKNNPEEITPEVATPTAVESAPAPRASKQRLSVTLDDKGAIDFAAMRESTKEQLRKALAGAQLGSDVKLPAFAVNREFVPQMYDSFASMIQLVGTKLFKWPPELTQFIRYSDEEKKALTEPTAKILEKSSPTWLLKYQEEAALVQMLVVASRSMVERAVGLYVMQMQHAAPRATQPAPQAEGAAV